MQSQFLGSKSINKEKFRVKNMYIIVVSEDNFKYQQNTSKKKKLQGTINIH